MKINLVFLLLVSSVSFGGYTIDPHDESIRSRLWVDGVVPYKVDAKLNSKTKTNIATAVKDYNTKTILNWIPRTNQKDYVEFTLTDMRASGASMGRQIGRQEIRIHNNEGVHTLAHEMGHTIGLYHEFSNPEMKKWLVYVPNNTKDKGEWCRDYFFNTIIPDRGRTKYSIWDSQSIMHYNHGCFLNRDAPLRVKASYPGSKKVWSNGYLSAGDIKTINGLYSDKTPKKEPWGKCENDPRVTTCDDFKAKGKCSEYSMAIAAYKSCKLTCGLCKGDHKQPEPKPEPTKPMHKYCPNWLELVERFQCK